MYFDKQGCVAPVGIFFSFLLLGEKSFDTGSWFCNNKAKQNKNRQNKTKQKKEQGKKKPLKKKPLKVSPK